MTLTSMCVNVCVCVSLFQSTLVNLVKHDVDVVTRVPGTAIVHVVTYDFDLWWWVCPVRW